VITAFRPVNLQRVRRHESWTHPGVAAIAIGLFVGASFFAPTAVRAFALPAEPVRSHLLGPAEPST
jgi:hypothetical protein